MDPETHFRTSALQSIRDDGAPARARPLGPLVWSHSGDEEAVAHLGSDLAPLGLLVSGVLIARVSQSPAWIRSARTRSTVWPAGAFRSRITALLSRKPWRPGSGEGSIWLIAERAVSDAARRALPREEGASVRCDDGRLFRRSMRIFSRT